MSCPRSSVANGAARIKHSLASFQSPVCDTMQPPGCWLSLIRDRCGSWGADMGTALLPALLPGTHNLGLGFLMG